MLKIKPTMIWHLHKQTKGGGNTCDRSMSQTKNQEGNVIISHLSVYQFESKFIVCVTKFWVKLDKFTMVKVANLLVNGDHLGESMVRWYKIGRSWKSNLLLKGQNRWANSNKKGRNNGHVVLENIIVPIYASL
jgi:hypothetical protein